MATVRVGGSQRRFWTGDDPIATIADGDTVTFDAIEAAGGQWDDFRNGDPFPALDPDLIYPLIGPIHVAGADVGDTIELEPLDYGTTDWGWTAVLPGKGLLPEDFPDAHLHRWELRDGTADFLGIARIPLRPFLGVMAAVPPSQEPLPVGPPGTFGGNLDCRDLVAGSRVFLPVSVPGAHVMLGDPHVAQGDGEVCTSAIESSLSGTVRIRLHEGLHIPAPRFVTPGPLRPEGDEQGYVATMGVRPDLRRAAQDAVRSMIDLLGTEYGVEPLDAYVLSSVAVDLRITEIVDAPNWVVSAYLPRAIMRLCDRGGP